MSPARLVATERGIRCSPMGGPQSPSGRIRAEPAIGEVAPDTSIFRSRQPTSRKRFPSESTLMPQASMSGSCPGPTSPPLTWIRAPTIVTISPFESIFHIRSVSGLINCHPYGAV